MRAAYAVSFFALAGLVAGVSLVRRQMPERTLPSGRMISPQGLQTGVGSFPCNLAASSDGRYVLATNCGFRENLSVLEASSGAVTDQIQFPAEGGTKPHGLYFGLAVKKMPDGSDWVAVSHGSQDLVTIYRLSGEGKLQKLKSLSLPAPGNPAKLPNHVAGLAWSADGARLYAIGNQSHVFNDFRGTVFSLDVNGGSVIASHPVGSFPLSVAVLPSGEVSVTNEGGRGISILDPNLSSVTEVQTGEQPSYESVNHAGTRLFVSNSNSDTVSEIALPSGKVVRTILLRPEALRGYPGATPLGSAVAADDKTLYVAMADLNAVAVVDTDSGRVKGYSPSGWYPTAVCLPGGASLFVANAKGAQSQNPNSKPVRNWGQYAPNILEGTVAKIDLPQLGSKLAAMTKLVAENNQVSEARNQSLTNPGIKHIFYIIKENRTYDQVLGDMGKGNGDPTLTLFGKQVTPNQHALAARFGLYDNFYVCAEVSADGWNWSTSGEANEYTQRNVPYNYSGRGRNYDFEGTNNGTPVDLDDRRDVAAAPGGYLWDAVLAKGRTIRNYGMFLTFGVDTKGPDGKPIAVDNMPNQKKLAPLTCLDFRKFDMAFPDSDAKTKLNVPLAPREKKEYGSHHEGSRIETWLREFRGYVANGNLPNLNLLRLPRNHTSGTSADLPTPVAMVADNDYAVGELVDAVSHSPYWSSSAIFVLEDDAQDGFDHIDCHRSPVLVISPFVERNRVDSSFYNTDSVLATIERLLGCKPGNQYLACARPFQVFGNAPSNREPFEAILADKGILSQVNSTEAYRQRESSKLISLYDEDSSADFVLNDILWHSIKGRNAPVPHTPGAIWSMAETESRDR